MKTINQKECLVKFGEFIKCARENRCINQFDASEKIGISQTYLSYIERGKRNVDLVLAIKMCESIGVDIKDFLDTII
jgi:DNA-binding XRE family transcriptional regulator